MREAVIVSAVRTAVGKAYKGNLSGTRIEDITKPVLEEVIRRAPGVKKEDVEDIIIGCSMPEGEQGLNFARTMALYAGFPVTVPALTINRFCSSGLQSIAFAAERIIAGFADVIIAGGAETMSHVPMTGFHYSPHPVIQEELPEIYMGMGVTAENVAERYGITREEQDLFAVASHQKAARAIAEGKFKDEIVPIPIHKEDEIIYFDTDEGVRAETNSDSLAKLKTPFKEEGTVTAGNSSQMSDAAAAVLVMSREKAEELGLKPLAVFRSFALTGVEPEIMGIGPVKAIPKALKMADITKEDIKLVELNEAFASQTIQVIREVELDKNIVNVNGGAIALGHPLGCTGTKLTVSLIHELQRRGGGYGVVTMCIGGGMGAAGVFEVLS